MSRFATLYPPATRWSRPPGASRRPARLPAAATQRWKRRRKRRRAGMRRLVEDGGGCGGHAVATSTILHNLHQPPQPSSFLRQPEDEYRITQRIADLEVPTRGDGDELFAVHLEHGRRGIGTGAAIERPEDRAGLGVVRLEPTVALTREPQAARRGGRSAHHRQLGLHGPGDLARVQVDRVDVALLPGIAALFVRNPDERGAEPEAALLPGGVVDLVVHRLMQAPRVRVGQVRENRARGPSLPA